jgi:FixJ family two-component response regulator
MRIAEVIEAIREQLGPNLTLIMDGQYIGGEAKNIIDALSADLAHHAVRVIVMTGDSQAAINVSRAFPQVPALAKPVDIQVLLETIRTAVPFKL